MIPVSRAALVVAAAFAPLAAAQQTVCDPQLVRLAAGPQGYAMRGNRCEGVYDTPVTGSALYPVSLTAVFEDYTLDSREDLVVRWPAEGAGNLQLGADVRLRAMALDPRGIGYRMDALVATDTGRFDWPVAILAANGLRKADIGMLAWTTARVGGADRTVHLPAEIARTRAAPRQLRLRAFAGASLRSLLVSVFRMEDDGGSVTLAADVPHPAGVWPAGDVIDVDLAAFGVRDAGLYVVQLSGTTETGAPAPFELWLYHAGTGGPR